MTKKNILLAVSGLSPAVITEALYALTMDEDNSRHVDEIHIITTGIGRDRLTGEDDFWQLEGEGKFFGNGRSKVDEFLTEYGITKPVLCSLEQTVHVIARKDGSKIRDILTPEDDRALVDKCLELAKRFSEDPDTAIFYLVAGGRKTMTSNLTLAAQLYGRSQDRIYHVLVEPPELEEASDFWYPPKDIPAPQYSINGCHQPITDPIKVNLIQIDYVSVRQWINPDVLANGMRYVDFVASLVHNPTPCLEIFFQERKLRYGDFLEMDGIRHTYFALYVFLANKKLTCKETTSCALCANKKCFMTKEQIEKERDDLNKIHNSIPGSQPRESGMESFTTEYGSIGTVISKINHGEPARNKKGIADAFGLEIKELIGITSGRNTPHGISIDRTRIKINWGPGGNPLK